jgi:hypothetical protein
MIIRFEKVLEQVARAGRLPTSASALEDKRERKVRRLEEMIRAKEAMGDRIVVCLGAALFISALALPVYAVNFSNGYAYLPGLSDGPSPRRHSTEHAWQQAYDPPATGTLSKDAAPAASPQGRPESSQNQAGAAKTPFQRYVIHRATEASALIEGPDGVWWVTPGMTLPGVGQILSIERSGLGWTVVTSDTTISQQL